MGITPHKPYAFLGNPEAAHSQHPDWLSFPSYRTRSRSGSGDRPRSCALGPDPGLATCQGFAKGDAIRYQEETGKQQNTQPKGTSMSGFVAWLGPLLGFWSFRAFFSAAVAVFVFSFVCVCVCVFLRGRRRKMGSA